MNHCQLRPLLGYSRSFMPQLLAIAKVENALTAALSLASEDARNAVQEHIKLLQRYNDLKDTGQQLIGIVAENRGVPVASLYRTEEFGVGPED
jgi:hypothetical protein